MDLWKGRGLIVSYVYTWGYGDMYALGIPSVLIVLTWGKEEGKGWVWWVNWGNKGTMDRDCKQGYAYI